MTEIEMLEQFLSLYCPGLPVARACNIMLSPHATFDAVVDEGTGEVVGGILYMSYEECGFTVIGAVGGTSGEMVNELIAEAPRHNGVYAPFEFEGAKQVLQGWWCDRPATMEAVAPLFLYYNVFLAVPNALESKVFCDTVAPLYK